MRKLNLNDTNHQDDIRDQVDIDPIFQLPAFSSALWQPQGTGGPGQMAKGGGGGGGGKNTGSGGSGSTSGTGTGGSTSGSGSGTTTTTTGSTSQYFVPLTILSPTLHPPTGDSGTPTDTYFSQEWGLTSATAGIDVVKAWQNYTGAGVKVGVIDDGFDYNHPDIKPNYQFNLDYDTRSGTADAFGDPTADNHGTTTMGVIGAARNGTGTVGVAYNAELAGYRIGYGANGSPSQIADAFNHALSSGMDVANNSWSYSSFGDDFYSSSFAGSKSAILNDVMQGRGGLGMNIVFSAGNDGASGGNVNYHNFQNDPYVVTVAATDAYGHVTSYSTPGAALLVSAPGTAKTDDRLGTDGYNSADYINISGTSYSAPAVSGIIALMLQANPNLGFRDVQEILALTAKNSDPASTSWQTNGAHDWNGGGMHFSHDYGFGLVDATAAVRLAESWIKQSTYADMSSETVVHSDNLAIPDGTGSLQSHITLGSSLLLDKVVVDLDITHTSPHDLTVTLTSPSGTTAVLAAHPAGGTGSGILFETSAATFMGEDAKGDWTLTVTDSVSGNTGTLNGWTLQGLGDAPSTPSVYVYTDEFATAAGTDRSVLHDTSGTAMIDTAAVTSASTIDLHPGAFSTIAGHALQIGTDTTIKSLWTGDGNDTIVANDAGDTIQAGRGNDTIVAGTGGDTLSGGPGSDSFVFKFLGTGTDTITDFTPGTDYLGLHQLFASLGYTGSDPVADSWLKLVADASGGTDFVVDPHNGGAPVTIADLSGVSTSALHEGTDFWSATLLT
jgi:subtilisin-like proprotein convertase family protein